jgi:Clp protease
MQAYMLMLHCRSFDLHPLLQDSLRASAFYVPSHARIPTSEKQPTTMRRGGGGSGVLTPGQAPPDLPSLLLDSRIVYVGMPLVASVTELVVSELLWLNYNQPEKPIYLYINSLGSQKEQQAVGFETEAYAILDTMNVRSPDCTSSEILSCFQWHGL